jgi:hypothetical protein
MTESSEIFEFEWYPSKKEGEFLPYDERDIIPGKNEKPSKWGGVKNLIRTATDKIENGALSGVARESYRIGRKHEAKEISDSPPSVIKIIAGAGLALCLLAFGAKSWLGAAQEVTRETPKDKTELVRQPRSTTDDDLIRIFKKVAPRYGHKNKGYTHEIRDGHEARKRFEYLPSSAFLKDISVRAVFENPPGVKYGHIHFYIKATDNFNRVSNERHLKFNYMPSDVQNDTPRLRHIQSDLYKEFYIVTVPQYKGAYAGFVVTNEEHAPTIEAKKLEH